MLSGNEGVCSGPDAAAAPLRLLHVATTKSHGGVETHSLEMAAALRDAGLFVQFACRPGGFVEARCRDIWLPVVPFLVRNSGDLGAARRLAQIIRRERIDIVHVHSRRDYVAGVLGVALARRVLHRQVGLVLHAHMLRALGEPAGLSGRFFAWGADAVVAVSSAVGDFLRQDFRRDPAFVRVIPNGVKMDRFALPGSPEAGRLRETARHSLGISPEVVAAGMIGRLDAKGQRRLFEVVPALLSLCPNLHIVLVGSEGKPGEQAHLTAQAQAGGFPDRVIFTGPRSDVPALLPAFDLLVHLPIDEAFGLALAEGMAAGLPTIATAIGGCREVVRDGITGRLVPPGDPAALLAALTWLLDPVFGPERRAKMGAAGRAVVQSEFSQDVQIERLLTLYRELCPVPF